MDPKKLNYLRELGINIPRKVTFINEIKDEPFQICSLRLFSDEIKSYKDVENALNKLKSKGVIKSFALSKNIPVFIYHLVPCKLKELVRELNLKNFVIEAYDVTNFDVVASFIVKKEDKIYF